VTGQRWQRMVNMAVTGQRGRLVNEESDRPTWATNGQREVTGQREQRMVNIAVTGQRGRLVSVDSDRPTWRTGQCGQ